MFFECLRPVSWSDFISGTADPRLVVCLDFKATYVLNRDSLVAYLRLV